jgi:hypothetical protein
MGHRSGFLLAAFLIISVPSASATSLVIHGTVVSGKFPSTGASVSLNQTGISGYGEGTTQLAGPIVTKAAGTFVFKLANGCPSPDTLIYVTAHRVASRPSSARRAGQPGDLPDLDAGSMRLDRENDQGR